MVNFTCPPSWTTVPRYLVQHYPVSKRISLDKIYTYTGGLLSKMDSLVAQMVKNPPAMQDIWVQSLGQEDPLEKGMATYYSVLAWRIPWTEEPGGLESMGSQRSWHDWVTNTFTLATFRVKQIALLYVVGLIWSLEGSPEQVGITEKSKEN